ncbi:hypothetical protein ACFLWM_02605 [Chloroflexota bacterium]
MAKQVFSVPFALELMGKSVNEVLDKCVVFDPQLSQVDRELDQLFDARVGCHCCFKIEDYQAHSIVGINFVMGKAVESIISLEEPVDMERFPGEYEVFNTITRSLEKQYSNGRVQQDDQEFGKVFLWKTDCVLIGLVSYPEHGANDLGVLLSVQIRDIKLHPDRSDLLLWYEEATNPIPKLWL